MSIILNSPMVDYLTVTTYDKAIGEQWRLDILKDDRMLLEDRQDRKRLQYTGIHIPCDGGSIFWGKGEQGKNKRNHYLMQISGSLADQFVMGDMGHLLGEYRSVHPKINCTRIDLQITVRDAGIIGNGGKSILWMQSLFANIQSMGKTVSWIQDKSGGDAIATVGINKRQGDTYYRIYAKPTEEEDGIRFEMEYKGDKASGALLAVRENHTREKIGQILKYQLKQLKSEVASELFVYYLPDGEAKIPKVVKDGESNTMLWLANTVLPSFKKQVATHEQGHHLARLYMDAIREAMGQNDLTWQIDE